MLLQRGTADATSGCVASGQARRDRLQMEAEKKGAALAAVRKREREALERAEEEERARNLQACEEGVEGNWLQVVGEKERDKREREREREQEMYDMWPDVAFVCAEDKHPLDYKLPLERIVALGRDNLLRDVLRVLLTADDDEFEKMCGWLEEEMERQASKSVKEEMKRFKTEFGFYPGFGEQIHGFNAFETTQPPPLQPAPTVKSSQDLVVPDSFASVPEAVWASSDGHRVFLRAGNHTWMGTGRCGLTPLSSYDLEAVSRAGTIGERAGHVAGFHAAVLSTDQLTLLRVPGSLEYARAINGLVMLPPAPTAEPVPDDPILTEYQDPEIESFCLHVTGERGARLCGRWLFQPCSLGSFSGVETVYLTNETALHEMSFEDAANAEYLDLEALQRPIYDSTLHVRGGPWLFESCGLRACMAVAVLCARRSLVKLRACATGGISHDRIHLSGAGRATMAIDCRDFARLIVSNTSVEMTGWDFQPALRSTGKVKVSVERCVFDRNIHSIGVFDFAAIQVRAHAGR